jgi:hypothetical protein
MMSANEQTRATAPTNPPCGKCGAPMHVIFVMPDLAVDGEKRTFQCAACGHSETVTVKY